MSFAPPAAATTDAAPSAGFQLGDLLRVMRERRTLVRNVTLGTIALAFAVLMLLPTLYSSSASVMLDPRKNNVTDLSAVLSQLPTDPASIQNQIQILTSRDLARAVIAKLKLYDDPEFNPQLKPTALSLLLDAADPRNWFRDRQGGATLADRDRIIDGFLKHLSVDSQGLSTTLVVSFVSRDPAKAALIANTLVDTYIDNQVAAKRAVGDRTIRWLVDRTRQLADQVQSDEAAVQRYKAENNLNETADGTSFADQQITAISNQLVLAKADLAQKQATNDRVAALMKAGDTADVSQILASPLIVQLRTQQAALIAQESDLSTRYGPLHPKMAAIETQKRDLQDKITTEVNRLAGSIANDVVVARAQVASLAASLAQAEKQASAQNLVRVKLKALEANAQSTRTMYEAFVTRLRETQDQDVIQNPDAHVISRAPIPTSPSSPKRMLILGASVPAGLLLGLLAALLAERFSAPVPARVEPARAFGSVREPALRTASVLARLPGLSDPRAANAVIDWPGSHFAQELEGLLYRLRRGVRAASGCVISVTAPDRGAKSVLAVALARTASRRGLRVAVVDCDFRNPSAARVMSVAPANPGLLELLAGGIPLVRALRRDSRSHAMLLAAAFPPRDSAAVLASPQMARLLAHLRSVCDVVIVDSPPLSAGAEIAVLSRLCDALLVTGRSEALASGRAAQAVDRLAMSHAPFAGLVIAA